MSFRSEIIEEEGSPQESSQTEDTNFKNHLPDNCVEYLLFFLDPQLDARKQLSQIENIRKSAIDLANTLTKDHIWQKDEFNLTLKNEKGEYQTRAICYCSDTIC
jgi:hypothetical protein